LQLPQIKLAIHIESPKGLMNLKEIASASGRIESMSLGVDDYCLELGVEPSSEGTELFLPFTMMAHVCKAFGIHPMGVMGSVSGYQDLVSFEAAAVRGKQLGATGGYCVHPGQVEVLNRVFSPTKEAVDHARRVVEAFEAGLKEGRAAITMDNMMIDTPIYKRALSVLELADVVAERESRKQGTPTKGSED
jgi:citrate lyase subunit beta/citryl-CoA lyase